VILEQVLTARLPVRDSTRLESMLEYWTRGRPIDPLARARGLERIARHYSASANPRTGVITLSVEAPSKRAAMLMADTALRALNDQVVALRRRHAAEERAFLEGRYRELQDSLTRHEEVLRAFYERNRQISSPQLQFEELRLRRQIDRVQSVFVQVGTQLEQARIQEVRDIPLIWVIDAPIEPIRKASPKLTVMLLTASVLGGLAAIALALLDTAQDHFMRRL